MAPILVALLLAAGCRQDMHDQPRYKPLAKSTFFEDGRASRPLLEGTVPRGHLRVDEHLFEGGPAGTLADTFPFPMSRADLERGRERYRIFCAPCHGAVGDGQGIIVERGFPRPETFHSDRLRMMPPGYYFQVITAGFGTMYSYSSRVTPEDRWRIAAYIQALQLSQHARFDRDVPPEEQIRLENE